MSPRPIFEDESWRPSGLLAGKRVVISGADSGIGRAVAVLFAKEGADIVIAYLDEHQDAEETRARIEALGRTCVLSAGDLGDEAHANEVAAVALDRLGGIDIVVNNSAVQYVAEDFADASVEHIETMVRSNLLSALYLTRACLPHLAEGATIINSTSVTAYRGSGRLVTYAATKGALLAMTRSLAVQLAEKRIRVNAVAPGPVWTPLIVESFSEEDVAEFGSDAPVGRAAQPFEIAPSYLFLAADQWSGFVSGQVIHPNGWEVVGG